MIFALAGHVDHGKTSLIRALTGIDPDRLPEERRRGMTIDLGFAYTRLPTGERVGFVDVPGHERFLSNMLAGVLVTEHALLVVAADDGPMPQTREHLDILRLTGVPRLLAVVTKADRVDTARLDSAVAAVQVLLAHAGYPTAPVLVVSARTGAGVPALRDMLAEELRAAPAPDAKGGFRLAIDRSFVLPGIGLVVTGAVAAGSVRAGESLLLTPPRLGVRVRGIHVSSAPASRAVAGDRCALAIAGPRLERARIRRGDWLVDPRLHAPTGRIDAVLRATEERGVRHGGQARLHVGADEVPARVLTPAARDLEPGAEGFVHLVLARPVAALHGDRLVLRDAASGRVSAGGHVIDPFPPERRRSAPARLARLAAQAEPEASRALAGLLASEGAVDLRRFALARNLDGIPVPGSGAVVAGTVAFSAATREELRARLLDTLAAWHRIHPDMAGPNKPVLLARTGQGALTVAAAILDELLAEGAVHREGAALRLPDHRPALGADDEAIWPRLHELLDTPTLRPPRIRELAETLEVPLEVLDAALLRLERFGCVQRVAANRVFLPATVDRLAAAARALAADPPEHAFTSAAYNARTGIGRNLSIQVLEYLDRAGVTRRVGDMRCAAEAA